MARITPWSRLSLGVKGESKVVERVNHPELLGLEPPPRINESSRQNLLGQREMLCNTANNYRSPYPVTKVWRERSAGLHSLGGLGDSVAIQSHGSRTRSRQWCNVL